MKMKCCHCGRAITKKFGHAIAGEWGKKGRKLVIFYYHLMCNIKWKLRCDKAGEVLPLLLE